MDVVSKGRAGILGIGAEDAKVRVTPIGAAGGGASAGLDVVNRILEFLNVEARPSIRSSGAGPDDPPVIDVQGEDAGLIIGRRGDTLRALQFVTNVILNRQREEPTHVIVDVEQYRERRFAHLRTLANRMAERAVADGRPVTLEPMPPADRRMIHVTLADNKGVTTESSGEGSERRVTIDPTGEAVRPSSGSQRGGGRRGRRPANARVDDAQPQPDRVEPQAERDDAQPDRLEPAAERDDHNDDEAQPDQIRPAAELDDDDEDEAQPEQIRPVDELDDDDEDEDEAQPDQIEPEPDDDEDEAQPGNR